jgi:hypothetical protein
MSAWKQGVRGYMRCVCSEVAILNIPSITRRNFHSNATLYIKFKIGI